MGSTTCCDFFLHSRFKTENEMETACPEGRDEVAVVAGEAAGAAVMQASGSISDAAEHLK